jgi:hypothetical protein
MVVVLATRHGRRGRERRGRCSSAAGIEGGISGRTAQRSIPFSNEELRSTAEQLVAQNLGDPDKTGVAAGVRMVKVPGEEIEPGRGAPAVL